MSRVRARAALPIGPSPPEELLGSPQIRTTNAQVVAEVMTGILLGPSALGAIPGYLPTLFPCSSLTGFSLVAEIGLTFYL
jgi:Kef-type K+ transport system membrane component KefB